MDLQQKVQAVSSIDLEISDASNFIPILGGQGVCSSIKKGIMFDLMLFRIVCVSIDVGNSRWRVIEKIVTLLQATDKCFRPIASCWATMRHYGQNG